jgi:hypothetical protein
MPFVDNNKIVIASTTTAGAAAQTAITSDAIDTAGYDGCLFIVPIGTIASTAVTSIKAQQCDTSGGSYADLTGTNQAIADDDDNKLKYIDIFRPREQFLKCVVTRGTADATIGGIIAVLYNASNRPTTHGTGVAGEAFNWPAEGTA